MTIRRDQKYMSYYGCNPGNSFGKRSRFKASTGDTHPYMKASFWANPSNHFWETELYSEASKEYFRKSLQA